MPETTATTTATTAPVLCVRCDGDTDKYVCDYEGMCERCYTKTYHPQEWRRIRDEEEWAERCAAYTVEDGEDEDEDE